MAEVPSVPHEEPAAARAPTKGPVTETKYALPTDEGDRQRLNVQHRIAMERLVEYLPSRYVPKEGDAILESGAATGIWAIEVSELVPKSVTITGIDIHSRLFPPNPPPNVTFEVQTILDLPSDWSSKFDFIHQRFLTLALGLSDWKVCLASMFRALKPGGWIRLEEFTQHWVHEAHIDMAKDTPALHRASYLSNTLCEARNLLVNSPDVLGDLIAEAGFEDVQKKQLVQRYGPGEPFKARRENLVQFWAQLMPALLKIPGVTKKQLDEIMVAFPRELEENDIGTYWYTFTARKPRGDEAEK